MINRILLVFVSMMFIQTTYADEYKEMEINKAQSFCDISHNMASIAMSFRQMERSSKDTFDKMSHINNKSNDAELSNRLRELSISIVKDAYSQRLEYSKEEKQRAISNFSDKVYLNCLENYLGRIIKEL
jgi:hypothetical protein